MGVLADYPTVWQLDRNLYSDGPNNASNNCGPSCVSSIERFTMGVVRTPDFIKDTMVGEQHLGYTSTGNLAWYLTWAGIGGFDTYSESKDAHLRAMREAIDSGKVVIALIYFNLYAFSGGHFVVVYGYEGDYWWIMQPWGKDSRYGYTGLREKWSTAKLKKYMKYWRVHENRIARWGYNRYVERWYCKTSNGSTKINVRSAPSLNARIVKQVLPGTRLRVTKYTDGGSVYNGSTRWHYATNIGGSGVSGWITDALLTAWSKT